MIDQSWGASCVHFRAQAAATFLGNVPGVFVESLTRDTLETARSSFFSAAAARAESRSRGAGRFSNALIEDFAQVHGFCADDSSFSSANLLH